MARIGYAAVIGAANSDAGLEGLLQGLRDLDVWNLWECVSKHLIDA